MPPSLRKRLAKRPPPGVNVNPDKSDSAFLPLLGAVEHLPKSKEDLTSTPPPPEHLLSLQNSQKARRSPPKSLLDRYKVRAPGMKAATASTPGEKPTKSLDRTTSFAEKLQEDEQQLLNKDIELEVSASSPIQSTIRTVAGVDFQMVNSTQTPPAAAAAAEQSKNTEPPAAMPPRVDSLPLRRSTRSQTRREQRADSAVSETNDISNAAPKSKGTCTEATKSKDKAAPLQSILKKKNHIPPTPARPKIPRTIRPVATSPQQTPPTRNRTPPLDSDSDSSDSDDSDDSGSLRSLLTSTAKRVADKPKRILRADVPPIEVVPPMPGNELLPGLVWISPLSANSRPDEPWTWCKRWTCCRCDASTIVEQSVCARIACGHHRCGNRCRVEQHQKDLVRF